MGDPDPADGFEPVLVSAVVSAFACSDPLFAELVCADHFQFANHKVRCYKTIVGCVDCSVF